MGPKSAFRIDDEEKEIEFESLGWIEIVGKSDTDFLTKNPDRKQRYFKFTPQGELHREEIWPYVSKQ